MPGKPDTQTVCGVENPADQRTPLVEALLRVVDQLQTTVEQQRRRIEQLEEEVQRLKGLPGQPRRKPEPSPLNDPDGPPSASGGKKPKMRSEERRVGKEGRSRWGAGE